MSRVTRTDPDRQSAAKSIYEATGVWNEHWGRIKTLAAVLLILSAGTLLAGGFLVHRYGVLGGCAIAVGLVLLIASMAAFAMDWRRNRRRRTVASSPAIRKAALQLGTELRDIRHKIDLVRSTRPTNHYSHDFQLPGARWHEYDEVLAAEPRLYRIVETAYTYAHHVNEALQFRRTRTPRKTIGVVKDDGLDEAYEAAGNALDALGETRGEVWESDVQRVVREVTNDLVASDFRVTYAMYGVPGKEVDVTERLNSLIVDGVLDFIANNATMVGPDDPAVGEDKILRIRWVHDGQNGASSYDEGVHIVLPD
jgi:hypothetical protein